MKIAYFDCFSGAAGDMIVGACLAAGADEAAFQAELSKLKLSHVEPHIEQIRKGGIAATSFQPHVTEVDKKHRHLSHIVELIDAAGLKPSVGDRAKAIFQRLAEAEAKVHGTTIEKVHFHEVGATDAILDIVGAAVALELLGVERIYCSELVTGNGTVQCEHGLMPVPAPATAELIKGIPLRSTEIQQELLTPTGAAILTTTAESFGPLPTMKIASIGYGAGTHDIPGGANVLRLIVGEALEQAPGFEQNQVLALEANIDDATPETLAYAAETLLAAGALDVTLSPLYMKKNRPATLLAVICRPDDQYKMEEILFRETPTFGIRRSTMARSVLNRRHETVQTPYGPIRVKVGEANGTTYTVAPEYEDCRQAAKQHNVSFQVVYNVAVSALPQP